MCITSVCNKHSTTPFLFLPYYRVIVANASPAIVNAKMVTSFSQKVQHGASQIQPPPMHL